MLLEDTHWHQEGEKEPDMATGILKSVSYSRQKENKCKGPEVGKNFQRGEKGSLPLTGREQEGIVVETEPGGSMGHIKQLLWLLTVSQRWS